MNSHADLVPLVHFDSLAGFPGLVHAVSTRHGGVSAGPFASLNLGWTVGDERFNVEANYQRWAAAAGVRRDHMTTTWQVHGNHIVRATADHRGAMVDKADGMITDQPGVPLTQRFADCTPLIVYDPRLHAAGLGHAGWRGTVADVAGSLVAAMAASFGSDPGDLVAVVGPAIGPCCYEVGPEVVDAVRQAFPDSQPLVSRPTTAVDHASARGDSRRDAALLPAASVHLNLWEANRCQLARAGVRQIEVAAICTCCHRDTYFSHRGDRGQTGRFAAVVMLRT